MEKVLNYRLTTEKGYDAEDDYNSFTLKSKQRKTGKKE